MIDPLLCSHMRLGTRKDVARELKITPRTVSEWTRKRRIPGPLQGTRRYDLDAILAALDRANPADSASRGVDDLEAWMKASGYED